MLLFRLCSRRGDKRRAGSKIWGDICIFHFFITDQLIFHQMFCGILANTAILLYCIETFCCFCLKTRNKNLHKTSPPHKSKGRMYNTYVHNATLSHQNFLVRHFISTPNSKRRHFALFSVSILLQWSIHYIYSI